MLLHLISHLLKMSMAQHVLIVEKVFNLLSGLERGFSELIALSLFVFGISDFLIATGSLRPLFPATSSLVAHN